MYNVDSNMSISSSPPGGTGRGTASANHYLWIVLPLIFGIQMADTLAGQGIPVLYPFIRNEFGLSRTEIGFITSAYSLGGLASSALAGWLTDCLGVKRIMLISLIGMAVCVAAILLAYSWVIILVVMVFVGVVSSPGYPATTRAVMDWVPTRIRALGMSLKQTGVPAGGALMAVVLPALTLVIGWRMAAASMGLLILAVAIVFLLLYREAPQNREAARKFDFSAMKDVFRDRSLVVSNVWATVITGVHFIALSYFMLFLVEKLQISPVMAGGLLAISQISSGVGRILWGAVSDFAFRGRRVAVLAITGFLTVTWLAGISLIGSGVSNVVLFSIAVLIGISALSYQGVFTTLIGELAGAGRIGVTAGVSNTMIRLGILVMPPLFGYVVDASSSYAVGWRVTAAVALVCTLGLLAFGREPKRQSR